MSLLLVMAIGAGVFEHPLRDREIGQHGRVRHKSTFSCRRQLRFRLQMSCRELLLPECRLRYF